MERYWINENSSTVAAIFVEEHVVLFSKMQIHNGKTILNEHRERFFPPLVDSKLGSDGSAGFCFVHRQKLIYIGRISSFSQVVQLFEVACSAISSLAVLLELIHHNECFAIDGSPSFFWQKIFFTFRKLAFEPSASDDNYE